MTERARILDVHHCESVHCTLLIQGAMCMSSEISDAVSSLSDVRYSDRAGDLTMRCPVLM